MNEENEQIHPSQWDKWDEIEYGLYAISSEITTLLKRLVELRTEMENEK
tara:strand:+ start:6191 stop:6337 length:147 start_codon:yes stop_codon:yes gene_type:complete